MNFDDARLEGADLSETVLNGATFRRAVLKDADLSHCIGEHADFTEADVRGGFLASAKLPGCSFEASMLIEADLSTAVLYRALFRQSDLTRVNLTHADVREANFEGANLSFATMVETNLERANISDCIVYGISAWNLRTAGAIQGGLILTPPGETKLTADSLELAQFLYTILNNAKVRDTIDTLSRKIVLILGRFTAERKAVLDIIRDELRRRDYLPVVFDFMKPEGRDFTETVSTLAHMARFVIADLTDSKNMPVELQHIVPSLPSVPVQPILMATERPYAMFEMLQRYPWVLSTISYKDSESLARNLATAVIGPAEAKASELQRRVSEELQRR